MGYTWTDMRSWTPYADTRDVVEIQDTVASNRKTASITMLRTSSLKLDAYAEKGSEYMFGSKYSDLYRCVTDMQYVVNEIPKSDSLSEKDAKLYDSYDKYFAIIDGYIGKAEQRGASARGIAGFLMGIKQSNA